MEISGTTIYIPISKFEEPHSSFEDDKFSSHLKAEKAPVHDVIRAQREYEFQQL